MHYKLQYFPDPGIAYDLAKMCFVKLNSPDIWQESLTVINPYNNYTTFIQEQAQHFPSPKSEVLLFVYIPSNKKTTFLSFLISQLISKDFSSFSISDLISYFDNTTEVQNALFSYYLGEENYLDIDLDHVIRHNKVIPDKIKIMLLGFSLYPSKYISSLTKTITEYYSIIQNLWNSLSKSEPDFDSFIDLLIQESQVRGETAIPSIKSSSISYSLCITTPLFLYCNLASISPFFITTLNTIDQMLHNSVAPPTIDLLQGAQALSDPHRLKIINLLIFQKQVSLQEIIDSLNLSSTAVKYHISILKKADLIRTIRQNRKILYSHNLNGFRNLIRSLENIEKGGSLQ